MLDILSSLKTVILEHKSGFFLGALVAAYPFVKKLDKKIKDAWATRKKDKRNSVENSNLKVQTENINLTSPSTSTKKHDVSMWTLSEAAVHNQIKTIHYILTKCENLKLPDQNTINVIFDRAVTAGAFDAVRYLLTQPAGILLPNQLGVNNAFMNAASKGKIASMQFLLEETEGIPLPDVNGLHEAFREAAYCGQLQTLAYLITNPGGLPLPNQTYINAAFERAFINEDVLVYLVSRPEGLVQPSHKVIEEELRNVSTYLSEEAGEWIKAALILGANRKAEVLCPICKEGHLLIKKVVDFLTTEGFLVKVRIDINDDCNIDVHKIVSYDMNCPKCDAVHFFSLPTFNQCFDTNADAAPYFTKNIAKEIEGDVSEIKFSNDYKNAYHEPADNSVDINIKKNETIFDIPTLFPLIFSENEVVRHNSAFTIAELIRNNNRCVSWIRLSHIFKSIEFTSRYYSCSIGDKEKINENISEINYFPEDTAIHLLGIASMNYDGYVREAAIKALDNLNSPEIIPYLLIRVTDWVPEVQRVAQEILEKSLKAFHPIEWIQYQELITRISKGEIALESFMRAASYNYQSAEKLQKEYQKGINLSFDKICIYIKESKFQPEILNFLKTASKESNLFYLKLIRDEIPHNTNLCEHALTSRYPEVRAWIIQYLPSDENFTRYIDRLLEDKALRVRYHALKAIPKDARSNYRSIFEQTLFDKSRKMREYSRFVIMQLNGSDMFNGPDQKLIKYHNHRLIDEKDPKYIDVLVGWLDIAQKEDLPKIYVFLDHKITRVRFAAFQALERLGIKEPELYLKGLTDKNSKIRYVCVNVLRGRFSSVKDQLINIFQTESVAVKKSVLSVLVHLEKSEVLKILLSWLLSSNIESQNTIWHYIERNYFIYFEGWRYRYLLARSYFFRKNKDYDEIFALVNRICEETNTDDERLKKLKEFLVLIKPS